MLRLLTAGESHGPSLTVILDGVPAGISLAVGQINRELSRRQAGYGRGGRMSIERDQAEITAGVRAGSTTGAPIALIIKNRDWSNWSDVMRIEAGEAVERTVSKPRPGHADLAGAQKYGLRDIRDVIERASARETAGRVAAGAVAKRLLAELKVTVESCVTSIGGIESSKGIERPGDGAKADESDVRVLDDKAAEKMRLKIDQAVTAGDTLGGIFEVVVFGAPAGLGSYAQWDRRLDGALARALMSIPAVKGVGIGLGFEAALRPGSQAHDEIFYRAKKGFFRKTNRAGGLEAGVTNGEPVRVTAAMKPIPTLGKPLKTVDIVDKKTADAIKERADICAVPAASVVGEAMAAYVLADEILEKFGADNLEDVKLSLSSYAEGRRR